MTKRERIIKAVNHENTDFVPYSVDFTTEELEKCIAYTGDKNFYENIGNHMINAGIGSFRAAEKPGHFIDHFNVVWDRTRDKDIGIVAKYQIEDIKKYNYKFPEIDEKRVRADIERVIKNKKDKFFIFDIGFSLFERAWTLAGMENLLESMITAPEAVKGLMQRITDYNLKAIKLADGYKEIDAIMFGDDYGQQKGLIMGAKYWREFIKPYLAQMFKAAKKNGKFVFLHSCGDIEEIFPDLVEIGLNAYQTFQPEIYDIKKVKKEWGDKLTFWGGISTQQLLVQASPEEVERVTRETIKIMSKGGGYIAAPTHAMPRDIPVENVLAMLKVFKN